MLHQSAAGRADAVTSIDLKNQAPVGGCRQHRREQDRRALPISAPGPSSWSSAARAARSTTAARPACPTCTAWSCGKDFAENYPGDRRRLHQGDPRGRPLDRGEPAARAEHDGEMDRRREGSALHLLLAAAAISRSIRPSSRRGSSTLKFDHAVLTQREPGPAAGPRQLDHRSLHSAGLQRARARLRDREGARSSILLPAMPAGPARSGMRGTASAPIRRCPRS